MLQEVKVVGWIDVPNTTSKYVCTCDYCGNDVDDSWGDPRTKVTRTYSDGTEEIRYICSNCEFEEFGALDESPRSIFDGTPDWMRML